MKTNNSNNKQTVKKGGDNNVDKVKKPFNKKKYREQKYSLKHKVKQFEDRRNTAIKRSFFKSNSYSEKSKTIDPNSKDKQPNKKQNNPWSEQWKFKAEQKRKAREEKEKAKKEREKVMKEYQEKRRQINKKMTKKNKWGQPALYSRMEVLHERLVEKLKKNQL